MGTIGSFFRLEFRFDQDTYRDLAVTPTGRVLATTGDFEITYSDDQGDTWVTPYPIAGGINVSRLFVLSSGRIIGTQGNQVTLSDDDGETWTQADTSSVDMDTDNDLLEMPSGRLIMVSGLTHDDSFNEVYGVVSDDQGETWSPTAEMSDDYSFFSVERLANNRVMILGNGVDFTDDPSTTVAFVSDDEGDTWSPVSGLNGEMYYAGVVYIPDLDRTLVFMNNADNGRVEVFVSTDNADSWSLLSLPGMDTPGAGRANIILAEGPHLVVAFDNFQGIIVESTDGGDTWNTLYGPGNWLLDENDNEIYPDDHTVLITTPDSRLLFTANTNNYLIAAPSDLVAVNRLDTGPGDPPAPWWTGYEGVTEVRRA